MAVVAGRGIGRPQVDQLGVDVVDHQAAHRDLARQPGLAGEADLVRPVPAAGEAGLGVGPREEARGAVDDEDPAGGAPSLPAAGVVVGDAVGERRLQDRPAGLLVEDDLPVRLLVDDLGHLDQPVQSGGGQPSPMTRRIVSRMAVTCTPSSSGWRSSQRGCLTEPMSGLPFRATRSGAATSPAGPTSSALSAECGTAATPSAPDGERDSVGGQQNPRFPACPATRVRSLPIVEELW